MRRLALVVCDRGNILGTFEHDCSLLYGCIYVVLALLNCIKLLFGVFLVFAFM